MCVGSVGRLAGCEIGCCMVLIQMGCLYMYLHVVEFAPHLVHQRCVRRHFFCQRALLVFQVHRTLGPEGRLERQRERQIERERGGEGKGSGGRRGGSQHYNQTQQGETPLDHITIITYVSYNLFTSRASDASRSACSSRRAASSFCSSSSAAPASLSCSTCSAASPRSASRHASIADAKRFSA